MDKMKVARMGERLESILQEEAFKYAIELLEKDFTQRAMTSRPDERSEREYAHMQYQTLGELIIMMQSLVTHSYQIKAELVAESIINEF